MRAKEPGLPTWPELLGKKRRKRPGLSGMEKPDAAWWWASVGRESRARSKCPWLSRVWKWADVHYLRGRELAPLKCTKNCL